MSAPIPNLMTVEQLAEHYGKAKKTIQNKLTRGWGPTPVTDPDTMQVLGFEVEEVARFDRINKQTRKQRLYAWRAERHVACGRGPAAHQP